MKAERGDFNSCGKWLSGVLPLMLWWSLAWFPYFYLDCPWPYCESDACLHTITYLLFLQKKLQHSSCSYCIQNSYVKKKKQKKFETHNFYATVLSVMLFHLNLPVFSRHEIFLLWRHGKVTSLKKWFIFETWENNTLLT